MLLMECTSGVLEVGGFVDVLLLAGNSDEAWIMSIMAVVGPTG